jgi:hypothetical protein
MDYVTKNVKMQVRAGDNGWLQVKIGDKCFIMKQVPEHRTPKPKTDPMAVLGKRRA